MSPDREQNIRAAQELYRQSVKAGLSYGCLEVALVAFGTHLTLGDVGSTVRQPATLIDAVERTGLRVNWEICSDKKVSSEDIQALLEGDIKLEERCPSGEVSGYLFLEDYPQQISHAIAVFPPQAHIYTVIDTDISGNAFSCTAEDLASAINYVLTHGGSFEIAQIKTPAFRNEK
jgi:hypothetical protein